MSNNQKFTRKESFGVKIDEKTSHKFYLSIKKYKVYSIFNTNQAKKKENRTFPSITSQSPKNWKKISKYQKFIYVIFSVLKFFFLLFFLYLFLISLNFMTIGISLVSPYALRFSDRINFFLSNPLASLAISILITAIIQNATATTSIAVTMVGAGIIPSVKNAIPIIIGSNIGTCVTNSFIALTFSEDPGKFKRAFSAATLNDIFNFLTTIVLLSTEIWFDFLSILSNMLASVIRLDDPEIMKNFNFIGFILNSVSDLFIKIDNDAINLVNNGSNTTNIALRCCQNALKISNYTETLVQNFIYSFNYSEYSPQNQNKLYNSSYLSGKQCNECNYLCMPMIKSIGDGGTGLFWIIMSLFTLIFSLYAIVKVLSMLISGPIAIGVCNTINISFLPNFKWINHFFLFFFALFITLMVQSSNIITATLVPLYAIGLVSLQRVYVMTLGSNIGTTLTGILSAFTLPSSCLRKAMQLAFVYSLFNCLGVLLWLPVPYLRFPKFLAKKLGNIALEYKSFIYVYILSVYFIGPIVLLSLVLIPYWIILTLFGILIFNFLLIYSIVIFTKSFKLKFVKSYQKLSQWMSLLIFNDLKIKNFKLLCLKKKIINRRTVMTFEDQNSFILTNFIKRLSVINSVVQDAIIFSKNNNIVHNHESSEDENKTDILNEKKLDLVSKTNIDYKIMKF